MSSTASARAWVLRRLGRRHGASPVLTAAAAAVAVALLVLGPALGQGFVLVYDMVFTPDQPLVPRSVGLGPQLPRAVPVDAVVALLSTVTGGELLQKAALLAVLVGAGTGAGRLAAICFLGVAGGGAGRVPGAVVHVAAAVASVVAVWNPWVAQRLAIGHWSLLVGYAVLPWLVATGWRVRRGDGSPGAAVVLCAVAALTPTGGLLAAVVLVVTVGRRKVTALLAPLLVAVNAPWWVPGLLHPAGSDSGVEGFETFAVRAETGAGALVSVLGLGGIWNAQVVTPGRATAAAQLASLLLVVLALCGWSRLASGLGRRGAVSLAALAGTGLVLSLSTSLPGVGDAMSGVLAGHVPGGGLLRDAHKWLALGAPLLSVCAGLGAARATAWLLDRDRRPTVAALGSDGAYLQPSGGRVVGTATALVAVSLCVLTVPDLAWGVAGRLRPAQYPADWHQVAAALDDRPRDEVVVVLPFQPFRSFAWNGHRTVLDPAPRWFAQEVVVEDRLSIAGTEVAGESVWADRVRWVLAQPDVQGGLAGAGVSWVLVEHGTPGVLPGDWPGTAEEVVSGSDLTLYRLAGTVPAAAAREPTGPPVAAVVAADAVAVVVVLGCLAAAATRRRRTHGRDVSR